MNAFGSLNIFESIFEAVGLWTLPCLVWRVAPSHLSNYGRGWILFHPSLSHTLIYSKDNAVVQMMSMVLRLAYFFTLWMHQCSIDGYISRTALMQ